MKTSKPKVSVSKKWCNTCTRTLPISAFSSQYDTFDDECRPILATGPVIYTDEPPVDQKDSSLTFLQMLVDQAESAQQLGRIVIVLCYRMTPPRLRPTYVALGKKLGVSGVRAKEIVDEVKAEFGDFINEFEQFRPPEFSPAPPIGSNDAPPKT